MTDNQARFAVFKAAMRDYFYESNDVMKAFFIPTDEQLAYETYDKAAMQINMDARDMAFEDFFQRIIGGKGLKGNIMKADGTPYPDNSEYKIADDFLSGKGIIFRGTDNEGFVKFKPENKDKMNSAFRVVNNLREGEPLPKNLVKMDKSYKSLATIKYDPTHPDNDPRFSPENLDSEKPKKLGWWNSIVKAFTGHPCQAWQKYENYCLKEKIERAMNVAEAAKTTKESEGQTELCESKVKEYQKQARTAYNKKQATKEAQYKADQLEKSMKELQEKFVIDDKTKSFKKVSTVNFEKKREAREDIKKSNETVKETEDLLSRLERENKEREEAKQKRAAEELKKKEQTKTLSQKRMDTYKDVLNSKQMEKIGKIKYGAINDKFKGALTLLSKIGEPNEKPVKAEEIAEAMTVIYLTGEMVMEAKRGYADYGKPTDNERTYAVAADELLSKVHPEGGVFDQIYKKMLDFGDITRIMNDPKELDCSIFGNGMNGLELFVEAHRNLNKMDKIIDNQCEINKQLHIAADKEGPQKGTGRSYF